MNKIVYIVLLLFINVIVVEAQEPHFYCYNSDNGLPSNEIYSAILDKHGFLWLGSDAGLFKFDGVHYTFYKSNSQKSKPITGLTFSKNGRLYCYNFQSQLFYVDGDSLCEIKNNLTKINQLACTGNNELLISYSSGLAKYKEATKTWTNITDSTGQLKYTVSSVIVNNNDEINFIISTGVGEIKNGTYSLIKSVNCTPVGSLFIRAINNDKAFIFSVQNNEVFQVTNNKIEPLINKGLSSVLKNKKITNAKFLSDNKLWITTYKGIVKYDPIDGSVQLYYPQFSFSDCLIDRENNYWFTTLHNGILCVPSLANMVWNSNNTSIDNEYLTHLASDGSNIYFSSKTGSIGILNTAKFSSRIVTTEVNTDVQSLDYDYQQKRLYFYTNQLYYFKNDQLYEKPISINAKSVFSYEHELFVLNSFGVHVLGKQQYKISDKWARKLQFDSAQKIIWIATNSGILKCEKSEGKWKVINNWLDNTQILSIDIDRKNGSIYSLTFDGKIYEYNTEITQLPNNVQANSIKYHAQHLYVASNKGLWIYNLNSKLWNNHNSLIHLASENIHDIIVQKNDLWLATSKGLQKIPLFRLLQPTIRARVYLRKNENNFRLNYKQSLVLLPETNLYSSNGNYQYAYRVNNQEWITLPSNIEKIDIQNLPIGTNKVELKVIDNHGNDSENTIELYGYIIPPFWLSWWFIGLCTILFFLSLYLIVAKQWQKRKKKLQLQNEINLLKLTAIKSQMNPHFIFNSLNSIQDLILKGDIEHSYSYITTFSELVRAILTNSEKEFIDFEQEINLIRLYLSLEKLRFKNDFKFQINFDDHIEIFIPPMLIQPFIENSLKHGLLHKKGAKKLKIQFILSDILICIIEDNGIGRDAAYAIQERQRRYDSFSNRAIKKRFEIFNNLYKGSFGFDYEDILNDNKVEGTKVTLKIPYKIHY